MGKPSAAQRESRRKFLRPGADVHAQLEQTLAACVPNLIKLLNSTTANIADRAQESLEYYYKMGCDWLPAVQNPDAYLSPEQKEAGIQPLEIVASVRPVALATIKRAIRFAELYAVAEYRRLLSLRNTEDSYFRLNWGHAIQLLSVSDRPTRAALENKTAQNAWTAEQLASAIAKHYGGKRRSGGRPMLIPKSVPAQVHQITAVTKRWLNHQSQVWHGEKHSIFTNLIDLPPDGVTPATLQEVKVLREVLEAMRGATDTDIGLCDRVITHYEECLSTPPAAPEEQPQTVAEKSRRRAKAST